MRTELFSVRQCDEELLYLNKNLKKIISALSDKCGLRVLYKTEIDANSRKIKQDIAGCLTADNPPELYIYINALDTKSSASFRKLFTPMCEHIEGTVYSKKQDGDGMKLYPNIKVYPITTLGGEYPAYCFAVKSRKFLVLPRISLVKQNLARYLCEAVNCMKVILSDACGDCPEGVVYLPRERKGMSAMFDKLRNKLKKPALSESPESIKPSGSTGDTTAASAVGGSAILDGMLENEAPTVVLDAPETGKIDATCIPASDTKSNIKADEAPLSESADPAAIESLEIDLSDIDDEAVKKAASIKAEIDAQTEAEEQDAPKPSKKEKKKQKKQKASDNPSEENTDAPADKTEESNDKASADNAPAKDSKQGFDPTLNNPFFPEALHTEINEDELVRPISIKKKKTFKAFVLGIIPNKNDDKREIIRKSAMLVGIIGLLVGAALLLNYYVISPYINSKNISEVQEVFYSETVITDDKGNVIATEGERNWAGLQKINKEIVGWIKLDKTKIDYPVLHHKKDTKQDQYYLDHNYKKQYSEHGSIFVDYRCKKGVDSRNLILHGHNMGSDNSMFASLLSYARVDGWTKGNTEFYKKTPIINFDTPTMNGEYVVFAVLKVNVSNSNDKALDYMMAEFESDAQFMNHIYNMKQLSYLTVDIPINENDKLLTLSTCSYEYKNARTVVIARKLRADEDVSKYVKKVKAHTPVTSLDSTFSQQLEAGNIKWYDGKGNLKGKEKAEYLDTIKYYTVTFVDNNGKPINIQQVMEGESATAPTKKLPRKAATDKVYYTFAGWDTDFTNVTKDLTIKPLFNSHPRPTVTSPQRETDPPDEEETIITNPPAQTPDPVEPVPPATQAASGVQ